MTKTAMKIIERYKKTYYSWLEAQFNKADAESQNRLLISVQLLEIILVCDCDVDSDTIYELGDKVFHEFYFSHEA